MVYRLLCVAVQEIITHYVTGILRQCAIVCEKNRAAKGNSIWSKPNEVLPMVPCTNDHHVCSIGEDTLKFANASCSEDSGEEDIDSSASKLSYE